MGRHPDDVCDFCLVSFGFAQITSDRLGFCHAADIPACILGKAQQDLRLRFLGLAERARQRLSGARLAFSQDTGSYGDGGGAAEGRGAAEV